MWPHGGYPLQRVGRPVLDRNPDNVFAEVEQAAFSPSKPRRTNIVPGIGPSPDRAAGADHGKRVEEAVRALRED